MNKIKRENRCIPDLIFQIEDYEKYLIQLSKITKINLLRHAKRSTSRDFRILEATEDAVDEQNPISEADRDNSTEHKSAEEHGSDNEKDEAEEGGSPKINTPVAVEETENEDEDEDEDEAELSRVKRARTSGVVQDSDEEEQQ